jgi:TM2 domain-containing membrane protein YozV
MEREQDEMEQTEKRINKHVYTWVGAFGFGGLDVDRFMRGQMGLGVLKLITFGGFGFWSFIDWIIALTKLGKCEKDFVFVDNKWA